MSMNADEYLYCVLDDQELGRSRSTHAVTQSALPLWLLFLKDAQGVSVEAFRLIFGHSPVDLSLKEGQN